MATVQIIYEGIDKSATAVADSVGDALSGLGDIAKGALTVGFGAATVAAGALVAGLGFSVNEALDAQKTQMRLAQVLKSTGGAAGLTQEAANQLAMQFRDLAGGSDEAILAIEEVGIRSGNVSANQMPKFIQATLDLGQVMGSTSAAAELLARAQEDPAAAFKRLEKQTGAFDKALEAQITKLQKSGKTAEANALIMDYLAKTTGGAAAANAETFAGKWEVMQGHLKEAAETIGNALLPIMSQLFDNVIKPAVPIIEKIATQFGNFISVLTSGDIGGAIDAFMQIDGLNQFLSAIGVGRGDVQEFVNALQSGFASIPGIIESVQTALQPITDALSGLFGAVAEDGPQFQKTAEDMFKAVQTGIEAISPGVIENISGAINGLTEIWQKHGDTILAVIDFAWKGAVGIVVLSVATIGGLIEGLVGVIGGWMDVFSLLFQGKWQEAFNTAIATITGFWSTMYESVTNGLDALLQLWGTNLGEVQTLISNKLMEVTSGIQNWIITTINTFKSYYDKFKTIGTDLIENVRLGIVMKVSDIINAVQNMVKDAISAAGKALGVASTGGGGGSSGGSGTGLAGGGVASGPESGYPTTLHGTEAVVPLPDGRSIPVQMQGGGGGGPIVIQLHMDGRQIFEAMVSEGKAQGVTMVPVA